MPPLEKRILEMMGAADYVPLSAQEIASELNIRGKDAGGLREILERMEREGLAARVKKDKFCLPRDADLVAGRILFRQSGAAMLAQDAVPGEPLPERIPIRAEDTGVALHGDRVLVRLILDKRKRPRYRLGKNGRAVVHESNLTGRVIRILQRSRDTLTGTLQKSNLYYSVVPDDPRLVHDVLVPDPKFAQTAKPPRVGDKVVVKLLEWKQRHLNPQGEIVDVLGKSHTPEAEHEGILRHYGLERGFPDAVMSEVSGLPDRVTSRQIKGRLDLREQLVFTIDPDDAKDFDDALSLERLEKGQVRIGIHIADVSAYVQPRSALDIEAQRRGNSTYLVSEVIPMLPHALSNGLCSLVEGEDRLTKSVFLTFTPAGKIRETVFANSVIRSRKRLTYHQAYALLKNDDLEQVRAMPAPPAHQTGATGRPLKEVPFGELKAIQKDIRSFWSIAERLRAQRMKGGSLDLDMPEVKIYVDQAGWADRIERIENDESHQLIEEFMLAANEAVARTLTGDRFPAIYRVHDKPDAAKLDELREHVALFGIKTGDLSNRREMSKLLAQLKDHPMGYTLRIQVLRSLKAACYRAEPDGHYGLNKEDYTHFTSPIRRYADLIVHRVLDHYMRKHKVDTAPSGTVQGYDTGRLQSLAEHITLTEQNSTEAERESKKVKLLEFFERESKKSDKTAFDAVITDIKNHGLFVELTESMAFGLVHISTLQGDWWTVSPDGAEVRSRRGNQVLRVGEHVPVQVERLDRFKRQIDFRIVNLEGSAADKRGGRSDATAGKRTRDGGAEKGGGRNGTRSARSETKRNAKPARSRGATAKADGESSPPRKKKRNRR